MHLIANLPVEIIETICSYLGWRHLGIVYPMFCLLAPSKTSRLLLAKTIRPCLQRSGNLTENFRFEFLNETSLCNAIANSPNILLKHFYDIFRIRKIPVQIRPFIDSYYTAFDTIEPHVNPSNKCVRRNVASIVFHPSEPIVAIVFIEQNVASFGVYAYAGTARAKKGFLLYHHKGQAAENRLHFMQISWSPSGSKLCCLEAVPSTNITRVNHVVANFFVLNTQTFEIRRIDRSRYVSPDATLELAIFGRHKLHNLTLWASDDDFYFPEIWYNRVGFSLRHINIAHNIVTDNVVITRQPTGIWSSQSLYSESSNNRPNLFCFLKDYNTNESYRYCNDSFIPSHANFDIPYGFWLVNNGKVLFTCEDCPNPQHIPHSILRRQAVLAPADTFSPLSGITFKHHRVNDGAIYSTDPSHLLLLLSCDRQLYTPWCSTDKGCVAEWQGSRYEPLQADNYCLGTYSSDDCKWGALHSGDIYDGVRDIDVYLGIIKGESNEDKFHQLAMGSIQIKGRTSHQYQLQIFGQTDDYVLIKECCNHNPSIALQSTTPRVFLFSKLLNQCVELIVSQYYPHPKQDIFLYFNFRSHNPQDSNSIIVLNSVIASKAAECNQCPTLSHCSKCNYVGEVNEFNKPITPVRLSLLP